VGHVLGHHPVPGPDREPPDEQVEVFAVLLRDRVGIVHPTDRAWLVASIARPAVVLCPHGLPQCHPYLQSPAVFGVDRARSCTQSAARTRPSDQRETA
jgi:hypothetical protein